MKGLGERLTFAPRPGTRVADGPAIRDGTTTGRLGSAFQFGALQIRGKSGLISEGS